MVAELIKERSIAGQHKAREEGRFPGRPTVLTERQKAYIREELARTLEVSRWKIKLTEQRIMVTSAESRRQQAISQKRASTAVPVASSTTISSANGGTWPPNHG